MHITLEKPELFVSKRGTIASSELALVPVLVTKEELEERNELYTKTAKDRKDLNKARINVDPELAARNLINYANNNKINNATNFNIKFDGRIHK